MSSWTQHLSQETGYETAVADRAASHVAPPASTNAWFGDRQADSRVGIVTALSARRPARFAMRILPKKVTVVTAALATHDLSVHL